MEMTREEFVRNLLTARELNSIEGVRARHALCQHDAALRARLAQVEEEYGRARERATLQARVVMWERALKDHWVTAIDCDHDTHTDIVRCACSVWTGTPQPSVGKAIKEWVEHVKHAAWQAGGQG